MSRAMRTLNVHKRDTMKVFAIPFFLSALLLVPSGAFCTEQTVTIPVDDYKAILNRLDALQKRVEYLETEKTAAPSVQIQPVAEEKKFDKISSSINDIYDTLDTLETKQLRNKLNFGAELRTRVDYFKGTNYNYINITKFTQALNAGTSYGAAAKSSYEHKDSHNDYSNWSNRFRINMDAEITSSLNFHGRLITGGYWGDSDSGDAFFGKSQVFLGKPDGLGFDRFYVDWIPSGLPFPFALTVGRQPSSEGPPFEFRENTVRQSTYPALLFNGIADGLVATFGLERYSGLKNSGLRFAYGKAYHSDNDSTLTPFPFFDDDEASDSDIYAAFLESEIPGLDNSLIVFSYARLIGLPTVFFGPMEATYSFTNENIGDMDLWGIHTQAKNVGDTGLDLFVSYAGNRTSPNDPTPLGLLSYGTAEERTGYAFYAGLRYTIPFEPLNNPRFGFEYNYGSKFWYSMTVGCPDPFNKLSTRGSVYDAYYIQPINKHLFFRAGYMRAEYEYTGSGTYIGTPAPSDATLDDIYLFMDVRF
jgi:hypothetical protein